VSIVPEPPSASFKRTPPRSAEPLDGYVLSRRLIGTRIAAGFALQDSDGSRLRLAGTTTAHVVYLFPGSATSPIHGHDTPLADAEEHRAFRDLHERMTDLGLIVVGVSTQPEQKLTEAIAANRLPQPLASDPTFRLGDLLRLPEFRFGADRLYDRLTMLIIAGKITHIFYPVPAPGRHAEEVLAHITAWR